MAKEETKKPQDISLEDLKKVTGGTFEGQEGQKEKPKHNHI